jgi:hypothetical protein
MLCAVKAKAVACEIDAVGIVDEAVENGVGVSRITDNIVPFVDWELAGDDCRSSPVAFFEDFEEIMPCSGIERFEAPVIKDEELHAPKRPQESGIATIAARQREISEELGNALIENGSVVAASPMAERASKPAFADAGRAAQDDVVVGIDPTALGQLLEQGAIETAGGTIVDVFDGSLVAKPCISEPGRQLPIVPIGHLAIEQQREPVRVREGSSVARCGDFTEGLGHAEQPELVELIEGGMGEHVVSLMVVARTADIGMEDRHAVRAALSGGVAVQIVVED